MRFLNIKLLALIAFLSIGSNVCAYVWSFSNFTSKTIVLRFGLMGHPHYYYNIVKPMARETFVMGGIYAAHCTSGFDWAVHDPNIKITKAQTQGTVETQNGGLDIQQQYINAGWTMIDRFFGFLPYPYKPVEIVYLPDQVYETTVKNAAKIGSGFDTFLCNAILLIKIANKGECPSIFSALINWIGGLIARSACTNRDFQIIEDDKGKIEFITALK